MKSLDAPTLAALAAPDVRLVLFLQFDYTIDGVTTTSYLCTATHNIDWNLQTWIGGGQVLSVESIREVGAPEAVGVKVTISGVPSTSLSQAMRAQLVGRPAKIYIGAYTEAGVLVSTPWLEWDGRADNMDIDDDGTNARITLSLESRLAILQKAEDRLWTDAEQKKKYPTDDGFKYVNATVERTLAWGPRR